MSAIPTPVLATARPHAAKRAGTLGTLPVASTVVTAITALYMLLVAIGNITDFGTNFAFVRHVLAMDTINFGAAPGTELDPHIMWWAVPSPAVQTAAYIAIIIWESATAVVLVSATALWIIARKSRSFTAPRRMATIGFLMMVILFMGGFITIGGEWFQMWRSDEWNGLEAAFQNSVLALFGLVLIHLPATDWGETTQQDVAGATPV